MIYKHTKHLHKQLLINIIFSILNLVLFIKADVIYEGLFFIPLLSIVYCFVLVVKERKLFDTKRPKLRFALLIISMIFTSISVLLFVNDDSMSLLEVSSVLCLLTTYINLVITLIKVIVVRSYENKQLYKEKQVDELDGIEPEKIIDKKSYPLGYVSKKDYLVSSIVIITVTLVIIIPTFIFAFANESVDLKKLLGGLGVYLVAFASIAIIRQKLANKPLIEFENDFDYEKLEKRVNKIISDSKVHYETRNYYKIILANYAGFFDLEKRKEILKYIDEPRHQMYKFMYDQVLALEFIDDNEKILEIYGNMKKDPLYQTKTIQRIIDKYIRQIKVSCGMINVSNIDNEFKETRQTKLAKYNNLVIKLKYYYYRNDIANNQDIRNQIDELTKSIPVSNPRSERVERFTLK